MIALALLVQVLNPHNSWSVNVDTDLRTHERDVSAMLLELDADNHPVTLELRCIDGRPDFSISWHRQTGPEMMVVAYGDADSTHATATFRRDQSFDWQYHFEGDIERFMADISRHKKPFFNLYFTGGSKMAFFETSDTAEAWRQVKAGCKPVLLGKSSE